jgi:hypothetical protein
MPSSGWRILGKSGARRRSYRLIALTAPELALTHHSRFAAPDPDALVTTAALQLQTIGGKCGAGSTSAALFLGRCCGMSHDGSAERPTGRQHLRAAKSLGGLHEEAPRKSSILGIVPHVGPAFAARRISTSRRRSGADGTSRWASAPSTPRSTCSYGSRFIKKLQHRDALLEEAVRRTMRQTPDAFADATLRGKLHLEPARDGCTLSEYTPLPCAHTSSKGPFLAAHPRPERAGKIAPRALRRLATAPFPYAPSAAGKAARSYQSSPWCAQVLVPAP